MFARCFIFVSREWKYSASELLPTEQRIRYTSGNIFISVYTPIKKKEVNEIVSRWQSMESIIIGGNQWQSMIIDGKRENTKFLSIDWSSISDVNRLIVIDCYRLLSIIGFINLVPRGFSLACVPPRPHAREKALETRQAEQFFCGCYVSFLSGQTRLSVLRVIPHWAGVRRPGFHSSIFTCLVWIPPVNLARKRGLIVYPKCFGLV